MDAEDLVVDQALDEVEAAPAGEHQSDVGTVGRGDLTVMPGTEHQPRADGHADPRRDVKEAVRERVRFEPGDRRHRMVAGAREQVMPLQELVQDDPVEESAQPDPEE
jgi:hypothetical protein